GSNHGASLGIGGATTSRIDDEVRRNNKNGAILKLGKSSTNIVASTSTMNDIRNSKSNIEEELSDCESSALDLALKL
ncbi:zinc finger protein, partial [Trifolium medium]|nr:zinc finger protein [Trifolium medium]